MPRSPRSDDVKTLVPALAHMAEMIGDRQVRNRGTMGGSLANNDPAACYPAAVLALDATIRTNRRSIAAKDFFKGLYETALEPDELLVSVTFAKPEKSAYYKFRQQASHFAMVGIFVAKTANGVRVAVTGAGPVVFRMTALEQALDANWSADACDGVTMSADGVEQRSARVGRISGPPDPRADEAGGRGSDLTIRAFAVFGHDVPACRSIVDA